MSTGNSAGGWGEDKQGGDGTDGTCLCCGKLREELAPIVAQLSEVAQSLRSSGVPAPAAPSEDPFAGWVDDRLAAARRLYRLRRQRGTIFGNAELFSDPAWDILLDLYIAHHENKPVSVSSACIGSASPPTTGLRWLGILATEGLILREADPADQRRVLVRLSARGLEGMEQFFAGIKTTAQRGGVKP